MKTEEFKKMQKEFNTTPFGNKTRFFSLAPFLIGIMIVIAAAIDVMLYDDDKFFGAYVVGWAVTLVGGCIAQLLYGILLKDYINKK